MQEYNKDNFLTNWILNDKYFDMLSLLGSLSGLFSDNTIPYLNYRITENMFCKYYMAENDARDCTSYDARLANLGIGIKTFILKNDYSTEKVAEFNKLRPQLLAFKGKDLARKLGEFRNKRIEFANELYKIESAQYHIIGRKEGLLRIFNVPYDKINIDNIHINKDSDASIIFDDGINEYSFNKSKSVLLQKFHLATLYKDVPVRILENPLELLEQFFNQIKGSSKRVSGRGKDYVILPLYSLRTHTVAEHSGLNQWNANGRLRHEDELYIPVPAFIHQQYPNFFPGRDESFELLLPDGKKLSAKMCQEGNKGLMSNPNKELGHWLLRDVLHKPPRTLVTIQDLYEFGFDSICVQKMNYLNECGQRVYKIYFTQNMESYDTFSSESE